MLAYIPAPWILWVSAKGHNCLQTCPDFVELLRFHRFQAARQDTDQDGVPLPAQSNQTHQTKKSNESMKESTTKFQIRNYKTTRCFLVQIHFQHFSWFSLVNVYITMKNHYFSIGKSTISMVIFQIVMLQITRPGKVSIVQPKITILGRPNGNATFAGTAVGLLGDAAKSLGRGVSARHKWHKWSGGFPYGPIPLV